MSIMREFSASPGWPAPSQPVLRRLVRVMTAGLDLAHAEVVVELGSGTGASRIRPEA
ncbi:hypothetical protein [Actinoplanes subtropicus]|uniref:hypothetical protein n=1 Tax=Actinoplanes subtropicus TaxID=543632 RepID=UPI000A8C84E8|nr:hypothetical protein [Actinoplanes subtropicus]